MEQARLELTVVEEAVVAATEQQMGQLKEFELAFVGGGVGEITPY